MFFLPLCKKNQKNQARPKAPPAGQANAHEQSSKFVNTFCIRTDSSKKLASCCAKFLKALSFSFAIFKDVGDL